MGHDYFIEDSYDDGKTWKRKAVFHEGDPSRFDEPFSSETALKEAQAYKDYFKKGRTDQWKVRVIIEI